MTMGLRRHFATEWNEEGEFVDFLVDGKSVLRLIPDAADRITPLATRWHRESVMREASAFLGEGQQDPRLENNQIQLAVCPQCGDLACGAVIGRITVTETEVVWDQFQWTLGYADEFDVLPSPEPIFHVLGKSMRFERTQYETAMTTALKRLESEHWGHVAPSERPTWLRHLRRMFWRADG